MKCNLCDKDMQPTTAIAALHMILGKDRPTFEQAEHFPWCCPDCHILSTNAEKQS